ncbi:hypothetical protein L3Q72_19895 [Vibrio sp. JC009]|uniref:hypothetical protein n=1 Tax=Vibrio sp. JC009 TaxID=2912314 RepID=UPI0023B084F4|nr:hypothetical protein [Vibrio sp. JC009]WED23505.1 hypothetical protein L3Q72_19895 [Vibrio sp. JC009]
MKQTFQNKDVVLCVSRFNENGWWLGNQNEHVAKGTALGNEFTENIYEPSSEKMIGKYDITTGTWTEIINNALTEYWSETGEKFIIGQPDGEVPEWGVLDAPPEFDKNKETVLYNEGSWKVYPIELGKLYWDKEASEFTVSDFYFTLPAECTYKKPPAANEGYVVRLVDGEWEQIEDYRDKTVYCKSNCQLSEVVQDIGPVKDGYTLSEPATSSDEWVNGEWVTNAQTLYEAEFAQVDSTRKSLYSQHVDPKIAESQIKHLQGNATEAAELEQQALAERKRIQAENPWPEPPAN